MNAADRRRARKLARRRTREVVAIRRATAARNRRPATWAEPDQLTAQADPVS
ncbi:MAG TPA: hypothetical protein VFZ72_02255 [Jiangellaceae bacterium]|jgi:hypothetical protein|nr:hypothetical protein [Jiangellaceae bacterium]